MSEYRNLQPTREVVTPSVDPEIDGRADYVSDLTPFTLEEADYVKEGPRDTYGDDLAENLVTKASSKAVRKIFYRFIRWYSYWIVWLQKIFRDMKTRNEEVFQRQYDVEQRQSSVETQLANYTSSHGPSAGEKDPEIIDARRDIQSNNYALVGDYIRALERRINAFVPDGFDIVINHGMGVEPSKVSVHSYEYGLDTEPSGFNTAEGKFGGTPRVEVISRVIHNSYNQLTVSIPASFALEGNPVQSRYEPEKWYVIQGFKILLITVAR